VFDLSAQNLAALGTQEPRRWLIDLHIAARVVDDEQGARRRLAQQTYTLIG
jgi:hypothetical protein